MENPEMENATARELGERLSNIDSLISALGHDLRAVISTLGAMSVDTANTGLAALEQVNTLYEIAGRLRSFVTETGEPGSVVHENYVTHLLSRARQDQRSRSSRLGANRRTSA